MVERDQNVTKRTRITGGMMFCYRKQQKRKSRRKRPKTSLVYACLSCVGLAVMRNPAFFGGSAAFLVSLAIVSVNALYYQPSLMHRNVFVSTRTQLIPSTAIAPIPWLRLWGIWIMARHRCLTRFVMQNIRGRVSVPPGQLKHTPRFRFQLDTSF